MDGELEECGNLPHKCNGEEIRERVRGEEQRKGTRGRERREKRESMCPP